MSSWSHKGSASREGQHSRPAELHHCMKQYFYRDNDTASVTANKSQNNTAQNKDNVSIEQAASVACVLEDEDTDEEVAIKMLKHYHCTISIRKKQ